MSKGCVCSFICSGTFSQDVSGTHVLREAWLTNELLVNKNLQKQKSGCFLALRHFKFVKSQKRYQCLYFVLLLIKAKVEDSQTTFNTEEKSARVCVCLYTYFPHPRHTHCRSVIKSGDATSKLFIAFPEAGVIKLVFFQMLSLAF